MFLLYHSEGCNICGMEFHKCYINDLRTTSCSGMLGHRINDIQLMPQLLESYFIKGLHENIGKLIICTYIS
jgi:hypothetical protein